MLSDAQSASHSIDLEALASASGEDSLDALEQPSSGLDEALLELYGLETLPKLKVSPRAYQHEALRRWLSNDGRGVVVLPTGAGKTIVAFMALEQAPVRTLVVVPTIELLGQWEKGLIEQAGLSATQVGVVGGGQRARGSGDGHDLRLSGDAAPNAQGLRPVDRRRSAPPARRRPIVPSRTRSTRPGDWVSAPHRNEPTERISTCHRSLDPKSTDAFLPTCLAKAILRSSRSGASSSTLLPRSAFATTR